MASPLLRRTPALLAALVVGCQGLKPSVRSAMPALSSVGSPNKIFEWKGFDVRYYALNEDGAGPNVILVHGQFVNADQSTYNLQVSGILLLSRMIQRICLTLRSSSRSRFASFLAACESNCFNFIMLC